MGKTGVDKEKRSRRYIRISDDNLWETIDEIMSLEEYSSFNKVINDALIFGLPELHKRLFDVVEIDGESKSYAIPKEYGEDALHFQLVRLLRESIANEMSIKAILCSIFNALSEQLNGRSANAAKYDSGGYKQTPDFIVLQEAKMLKEAGK